MHPEDDYQHSDQNTDWEVLVDSCTLTFVEITVAKVYREKHTTKEHTKYVTYSIPVLNEEAMGDVVASEIDEAFSKLAHEYTNNLAILQLRRIKNLQDLLKYGT